VTAEQYDPFEPGPFGVGVRTIEIRDDDRARVFRCEAWYPAASVPAAGGSAEEPGGPAGERGGPAGERGAATEQRESIAARGLHPLIIFSHFSGGGRRTATYLSTHLASHGYAVAAMDHSEVVTPELAPNPDEDADGRARRIDAIIASRVPDVRVLLSALTGSRPPAGLEGVGLDRDLIGVAGHSFGGWTALAAPEQEPRVGAVVALAPGGSSRPVPGVLPLTLAFGWKRTVPVLILTGDCDVPVPLEGVREVFARAPEPKRMFVLHRADHEHFADDVEASHEALRAMTLPGEAAWMSAAMLPASELCPGEHGHLFARALTLAHFDSALRGDAVATEFLAGRAERALAARGVDATQSYARAGA
jgi:dienelactone hydrolase